LEKISVIDIEREKNYFNVKFEYSQGLSSYFNDCNFWCEYEDDISLVPTGILLIPFLSNILPIIWIKNVRVELPELDQKFFHSLDKIRQGYKDIYPELEVNGEIIPKKVKNYENSIDEQKSILFFSGGVDATSSLLQLLEQKAYPLLVTIWGSDVPIQEEEGWMRKYHITEKISSDFQLHSTWIKSNFREFISEINLNDLSHRLINDGWWHGMQHGIGIISLASPISYSRNIAMQYISSSFSSQDSNHAASDPKIDNEFSVYKTQTFHYQYNMTRQEKIHMISKYVKKYDCNLHIHVCWQNKTGINCGKCDKCMRTAFGFLAEGVEPKKVNLENFSLNWAKRNFKNIAIFEMLFHPYRIPIWESIRDAARLENHDLPNYSIEWFKKMDFRKEVSEAKKNKFIFMLRVRSFYFRNRIRSFVDLSK